MKYQIVLTNVVWGNDYKNVRYFASKTAQETYFDVANKFTSSVPTRNLNAGNFTRLSVIVKTGDSGIGDIMTKNYAIIYDTVNKKYWYYFITGTTFDSVDQVRIELEIDVIQSYYLDVTFGDAMIERAHLPRFNTTTGKFNKGVDTPFLTRDEIKDLPKYIKTVTSATVSPFAADHDVSKWLDDNIVGWLYAYLDAGSYHFGSETFDTQLTYKVTNSALATSMKSPYVVICAPVFKTQLTAHSFRISDTTSLTSPKSITMGNFNEFVAANIANVYAVKFSPQPPFRETTYYSFDTLQEWKYQLNIYADNLQAYGSSTDGYVCVVKEQSLQPYYLTKTYTLPQSSILKSNITTYAGDRDANPKIFNTDYKQLKLVYGGSEYVFDIQKLYTGASDTIKFKFFEILTPEIAPTIITINEDDTIYKNPYQNRIGYVGQNDFTLPYSKNQLDVFLANNKNFFAQKQVRYEEQTARAAISGINQFINGAVGAGVGAASGNAVGAVTSGAGALLGIATTALSNEMSIAYDKQYTTLTLDNMQSGVDALANSNSNAFFNMAITDCRILLEELEAIPNDIARAKEDMAENGFTYYRMGNIKDFDHIRAKWNYIKATVEVIKTPTKIPNAVRETIKAIFAGGVRFWNTDTWDFEQTNLEV